MLRHAHFHRETAAELLLVRRLSVGVVRLSLVGLMMADRATRSGCSLAMSRHMAGDTSDDRSRPLRSTYCKLRYRRGAAPLQTLTGARQHLLKARARRITPRYSTKSSREPFETPPLRKAKAHAETAFERPRDLYTFAHLNSVSSLAGSRLMTNE